MPASSLARLALVAPALGALALAAPTPAFAQSCEASYNVEGVPMITALIYRVSMSFPRVPVKRAFDNVAAAVSAEGFQGIRLDRQLNSVSAIQETSGSGRPQTLRVTVRRAGNGSRVDAVFQVQAGQIAPEGPTRAGLCRVVTAAAD